MARSLNVSTETVDIQLLKHHPRNANKGDVEAIRASLAVNGWYGSVVVNQKTNHILAGNHRVMAAKALGWSSVPVTWIDVTPEEELRILLADNRTTRLGDDDKTMLADILSELALSEGGIDGTGYNAGDLDALIDEVSGGRDLLTDPDEVPDEVETRCKSGDLWILGSHRLLCGDSTKVDDVERLMDGTTAEMMVTDPPYGVEYDADWRSTARNADGSLLSTGTGRATGVVTNDDRADWSDAYALFGGDVSYVWHAGNKAYIVAQNLINNNLEIRSQIIWAKNNLVISRGDYHPQHEPCWYCVRKGGKGDRTDDRKQTTLWQIDKPSKSETGHSTQKPLECMARPMRNHNLQTVYDPFLGSGTTLIAAEQLGRKCYGMEISPKYCDVIIQRWENATGQKAVLDATTD